jgi:hypothetical protein
VSVLGLGVGWLGLLAGFVIGAIEVVAIHRSTSRRG